MGDGLPFASIAIPARNEERSIVACLDAVIAQDYPHDRYEVFVVDGESTDRTRELVETVAARSPVPIRVLDNPARITPVALNLALAAARGEYFVRVDGHSEPTPSYLRQCIEGAIELDAALTGGWVEPVGKTTFGRAVAAAYRSRFATGNAWVKPTAPRRVDSVNCGAYRARPLREVGGFDEEQVANQDYEVNYRLRIAGYTLWVLPDITHRYEPRGSLRGLARQFFRYGFYKARTMVKHPASTRARHLAPAAGLTAGVVLLALAPWSTAARDLLALSIVIYLLGLAAATLAAARSLDLPALVRLPLAFVTIHLCWGAGNVAGLVRWLPRRAEMGATVETMSA